ncbi:hypothetical protein [Salinicoccus sp. CNSTN-B1]
MIHYNLVNEYFDDIELPKPLEELIGASYDLEGKELDFINGANHFFSHDQVFGAYREKDAHCWDMPDQLDPYRALLPARG